MAGGNCRLMNLTPLTSETLEWTNKKTISKSLCINTGSQEMTSSLPILHLDQVLITMGLVPPDFSKPFDKASLESLVNESWALAHMGWLSIIPCTEGVQVIFFDLIPTGEGIPWFPA